MLVESSVPTFDLNRFLKAAVFLTRPGEAPVLQWIVDTGLEGPELAAFQQGGLGGAGSLTEHPPARGVPRGFTELRVAPADVPAAVVEQLPRRLRAALVAREAA